MIRTWDIPATIKFYTEVIGFICTSSDVEYGWAELERDGIAIMLSAPNEHEGDTVPSFTGSLYLTCDNVDEMWEQIQGLATVSYPIEDFDYGMREFGIYDNNGYLLQFGTPLKQN